MLFQIGEDFVGYRLVKVLIFSLPIEPIDVGYRIAYPSKVNAGYYILAPA